MEGRASISSDIIARYAADAALEVEGVRGLVEGHRRRGVRVLEEDESLRVELHVEVDWGAPIPDVGSAVQQRVREYLGRMADVRPDGVDVVVDGVGPVA
jgi:uncharacterized alkaline shock family protein YloU